VLAEALEELAAEEALAEESSDPLVNSISGNENEGVVTDVPGRVTTSSALGW